MTATTDNRELRALVKEMRAGTPCYVAKVGGGRCVNGAECLRCAERLDWAERLERALLARTEAASVADAELPGMWSTSDFTGGDPDERSYSERAAVGEVIVYDSYRGATLYGAEHCTLASGTKLYTHPQDASGDAEDAAPVADGAVEGDRYVGIRYDLVHDFAVEHRLDYNKLGVFVRSVIVTHPQDASGNAERTKYEELIYAVGNKYPGETRHETALRYIRQAESHVGSEACAAMQAKEAK